MAVQGSIAKWVANHRRHHLHADDVGDPHSLQFDGFGNRYVSALKGFLHAQGSWVFDQATTDNEHYAKDILADPIAMFFVRTRWVWYGMSAVFIPGVVGYTFGGTPGERSISRPDYPRPGKDRPRPDVFHASHRQLERAAEAQATSTAR